MTLLILSYNSIYLASALSEKVDDSNKINNQIQRNTRINSPAIYHKDIAITWNFIENVVDEPFSVEEKNFSERFINLIVPAFFKKFLK